MRNEEAVRGVLSIPLKSQKDTLPVLRAVFKLAAAPGFGAQVRLYHSLILFVEVIFFRTRPLKLVFCHLHLPFSCLFRDKNLTSNRID
jgi:hypothetical protein